MQIYKSKVLSFIEYRTPAIYHADSAYLDMLDFTQVSFLREIGFNEREAFSYFNLAPLQVRRDIAIQV